MQGSFTVQFFDLVVHIMPGVIVLSALAFAFSPDLLVALVEAENTAGVLALGFVAAYVTGFLIHVGLTTVQGAFGKLRGERRILDAILAKDPHLPEAEEIATRLFHFDPVTINAQGEKYTRVLYRYAETVVEDQMSSRWSMARRVGALAIFSRNLIPPALFVAGAALARAELIGWPLALVIAAVATATAVLLWWNWLVYWKRSVSYTLQAFVFWCRQTEREERTRAVQAATPFHLPAPAARPRLARRLLDALLP
ncbi:hypothetical protein [Rubricoccus marinus]|uniref:Uncharacterized protein n=1 Tax=Rubricoccus marinus TaxID=716817 RepID=A0A259TUH0_9BACT|nr:hypothetical protein [Rubricoccus marinus]OZC01350.1 hypothetical protein BSZ36_18090 [Rubricoccus marinus]